MIDIVTVVFRDELEIIKLQAQSIDLYCHNLNIGNIIVVINDPTMTINDIDLSWWGSLQSHVKVVERTMWSSNYVENGWVSQQVLKLLGTTLGCGTYSIILDAKTLIVQPILLSDVFDQDQKLKLGQMPIYSVFKPSQYITEKLFDIKFDQQLGPGGVPHFVKNNYIKDMIEWIEAETLENFPDWFQSQGMLTEFILYAGWIIKVDGNLDKMANKENTFGIVCNICHSQVDIADSKLQEMQRAVVVSIHRRAWQQLTQEQQTKYQNFLIDCNITQAKDLI